MKIVSIKDSGSRNVLQWAISNDAEISMNNLPIVSVINDELFFLVTIEGINMYELFRLTQHYRNKLKVVSMEKSTIPSTEYLREKFGEGMGKVQNAIQAYMSMTAQMLTDSDIIASSAVQLFTPMIATSYTVQIPFPFVEMMECLTPEQSKSIFTSDYPLGLGRLLDMPGDISSDELVKMSKDDPIKASGHASRFNLKTSVKTRIFMVIENLVRNIKYDTAYDQMLKYSKYFAIKKNPNKLHNVGLIGFSKFDNITRGKIELSLFKPDKNNLDVIMRKMSQLRSPLELSFAVQLPIHTMLLLEGLYFPEDVQISYRSSADNIVDNGMTFEDFTIRDQNANQNDAASVAAAEQKVVEIKAQITAYRTRMAECDLTTMTAINEIANDSELDVNNSDLISLLPSVYRTNAVITLQYNDLARFNQGGDLVMDEMFADIRKISNTIMADLNKYEKM